MSFSESEQQLTRVGEKLVSRMDLRDICLAHEEAILAGRGSRLRLPPAVKRAVRRSEEGERNP
jgi:hypothetical protein